MMIALLINIYIIVSSNFFPHEILKKPLYIGICGFVVLVMSSPFKIKHIVGYTYSLFHQYKGPLDYAIPYIQQHFADPSKLTIATNYEETSYMYYLNSHVIIGFTGNNIAYDKTLQPDIIIIRKAWQNNRNVLIDMKTKGYYQTVRLPVLDYAMNNIPESYVHLYKTPERLNDPLQLEIDVVEKTP